MTLLTLPWAPLLAFALALAPALVRWWTGRSLRADDPALPERLLAARTRRAPVMAGVVAGLLLAMRTHASWAVPLTVLLYVASGYPLRRRLFGDTWSLSSYLVWTLRAVIAIWGFWLLLMAAPLVVSASGPWHIAAAVVLVAVLETWSWWYPHLLLRVLGAAPLGESSWPPGFRRVLDGSRVAVPGLWHTGPRGARIANAIALPSLGGSHVLFTDTLLEWLEPNEQAAVLAHEVSHLELFTRALLVRWHLVTAALIITGTALVPAAMRAWPAPTATLEIAWPIAVFAVVLARAQVVRAQESPSDRRAVELCGSAEAVISGLIKLHQTARLPRRWSTTFEQRATHPSLARRVQAIRAAAGVPDEAASHLPLVLRGHHDRTAVVLETDRVRFLSGIRADAESPEQLIRDAEMAIALPYSRVRELRVIADRPGSPRLLLLDQSGRRWTSALDPARVPEVQTALDLVDGRLPATPAPEAGDRGHIRVLAAIVAFAAILGAPLGAALLVAACAIAMPAFAALAATAAAAIAAAMLALLHTPSSRVSGAALGIVGGWVLWRAWRARARGAALNPAFAAVVGLCTVGLWAAVVFSTRDNMVALHLAARRLPALVIWPLALAVAWAWRPGVARRRAIVPALLTLIGAAAMSDGFVDVVVRDPLRATPVPLPVFDTMLRPTGSAPVPNSAAILRMSPSGTWFAVASDDEESDEEEPRRFELHDFAGHQTIVTADDLQFIDDQSFLTIERAGGESSVLERRTDDARRAVSRVELTGMRPWSVWVNAHTREWRVTGVARGEPAVLRMGGRVGQPTVESRRWPVPRATAYYWLAGSGPEPVAVVHDYSARPRLLGSLFELPWHIPMSLQFRHGAWRDLRSQFGGACYDGPPGAPIVCVALDGRRTHVWTWDGAVLEPHGRLDVNVTPIARDSYGWTFALTGNRLLALDPMGRQALDLGLECDSGCLDAYTFSGTLMGALVRTHEATRVAMFRVVPATGRSVAIVQ